MEFEVVDLRNFVRLGEASVLEGEELEKVFRYWLGGDNAILCQENLGKYLIDPKNCSFGPAPNPWANPAVIRHFLVRPVDATDGEAILVAAAGPGEHGYRRLYNAVAYWPRVQRKLEAARRKMIAARAEKIRVTEISPDGEWVPVGFSRTPHSTGEYSSAATVGIEEVVESHPGRMVGGRYGGGEYAEYEVGAGQRVRALCVVWYRWEWNSPAGARSVSRVAVRRDLLEITREEVGLYGWPRTVYAEAQKLGLKNTD